MWNRKRFEGITPKISYRSINSKCMSTQPGTSIVMCKLVLKQQFSWIYSWITRWKCIKTQNTEDIPVTLGIKNAEAFCHENETWQWTSGLHDHGRMKAKHASLKSLNHIHLILASTNHVFPSVEYSDRPHDKPHVSIYKDTNISDEGMQNNIIFYHHMIQQGYKTAVSKSKG